MKTWTLSPVSGLVGIVAVSSLGCAGSTDEPESDRPASSRVCVDPSTGEAAPARAGGKTWQDDWLGPVSLECPVGMVESEAPPPAKTK